MSVLEELKSKPWFPWAVGAGVIVFLFWLLFWSTPEPGPMRTTRALKVRTRKKVSTISRSARGRTASIRILKRQETARRDRHRQQEIRDQFKNVGDALSDLTLQMKAEKESRLAASRAAPPDSRAKSDGQWNYGDALWRGEVSSD